MYESTFQFRLRPFVAAPLADRYFPAAAIEQALVTLARGIERAEGPGLLVGPAGTGKTLVCNLLAEHFRDEFRVALLAGAGLGSRRALLQNILYELGLPFRDLEEGELRLMLLDHLDPSEACPNGMLLLVDEAHSLPLRLLEEIRMITNLVRDGQPRVRVVLSGAPVLEERFASPRLQSFQQRLAARCYLKSLSRDETYAYIRWQITEAGGEPDRLFTEAALKEVYEATGGIPRLINQLCDHALIMAAVGQQEQLDEAGIEEAWADLQQLPPPLYGSASSSASGIVEYGQLGDDESPNGSSPGIVGNALRGVPCDLQDAERHGGRSLQEKLDEIEELLGESERVAVTPASGSPVDFADDEQFQPSGAGPEVELIFPEAQDPFGQPFEEEEILIDRYASIESVSEQGRARVSSDEGREIAAAISALPPLITETNDSPELDSFPQLETPELVGSILQGVSEEAIDPASDPVLPESGPIIIEQPRPRERGSAAAVAATTRRPQSQREANLRVATTDDRDAIVVDEAREESDDEAVHPVGKIRRQEYRQLFAKLRRG